MNIHKHNDKLVIQNNGCQLQRSMLVPLRTKISLDIKSRESRCHISAILVVTSLMMLITSWLSLSQYVAQFVKCCQEKQERDMTKILKGNGCDMLLWFYRLSEVDGKEFRSEYYKILATFVITSNVTFTRLIIISKMP